MSNPFVYDAYLQLARPKQSGQKQPPNMPVGIGIAWIDEQGNFETHYMTAYARSDSIAVALGCSELAERFPRHKFVVHTTVLDFEKQLASAIAANKNGGMTVSRKPFAALEYYSEVLQSRKDGVLDIRCEQLKEVRSEAFGEAYRIAHGSALSLATRHAQQDSKTYGSSHPLNMPLSWDGELLFSIGEL